MSTIKTLLPFGYQLPTSISERPVTKSVRPSYGGIMDVGTSLKTQIMTHQSEGK